MSHIFGQGWGDDHDWVRGGTNQVGSADPWMKASYYECANCHEAFAHSYDIYPDIFAQMQVLGISEHCPAALVTAGLPKEVKTGEVK
jgi:hypothetical protein